jgi:hypothetical protein
MCNNCKQFWSRCMLVTSDSDYSKQLWSSCTKKCDEWYSVFWGAWKCFCIKKLI